MELFGSPSRPRFSVYICHDRDEGRADALQLKAALTAQRPVRPICVKPADECQLRCAALSSFCKLTRVSRSSESNCCGGRACSGAVDSALAAQLGLHLDHRNSHMLKMFRLQRGSGVQLLRA